MTEPNVCAITVTYGHRWHLLKQVLLELVDHARVKSVIVVDNGSTDPISKRVDESGWGAKVSVVNLGRNTGSAGGFGAGLEAGADSGANLLWLLDDDNRPQPGALDRLLAAYSMMGEDPNVLLQSYRSDRYQYIVAVTEGRFVGLVPNSFQGIHLRNLPTKILDKLRAPRKKTRIHFPCVEIDCAPYGGLLLSYHWVEKVGTPNPDFFVYLDDYEYTYRITSAGGRIYLCSASELEDLDQSWSVKEPGARSIFSPSAPAMRVYYSVRNQTFLERRRCSSRVIYISNMVLALSILSCWSLTAGHSLRSFGLRVALLGRAVREGWTGKLGVSDKFSTTGAQK
jgi:GT2 family glycosyltransferase